MLSDKLLIGTYRGITFRFREAGRTGGRKTVFHTYPNSDINLAEDLGRAPISLTITIVVQGDENTYYSNRDAIIKALESDGPTILEHPTYGQLKVQTDGNYRFNERIDSVGYSEIIQTFRQVDNKKFMAADQNTESYIELKKDTITDYLENTFMANLYTSAVTSYETVKEYTDIILDSAADVTSTMFDSLSDYNSYNAKLEEITTYYPNKIADLGSNITDIFSTVYDTVTNPLDQFYFYENYFDFLDDATTYSPTTKDLYYTQNNQDAYKAYVQGMALSYATGAASSIDYETDEDQTTIMELIADQFENVLQLPFISAEQDVVQIDTSRDLSNDFESTDPITIYGEMQNQKVAFSEVMKDASTTTPKVIEIDVVNQNLIDLVYKYYGNIDNYDTIRDLNKLEQTSHLTGTYKILTA